MTDALPDALEIRLKKFKPLAPLFHRHIARSKLIGSACNIGDRVVVYEVTGTLPKGPVLVTENTLLVFD